MMNESVKKLLKASMWDLATCANGETNVVPVAFKDVTSDGKLVVGDVFLDTPLKNLAADGGKIAISIYDAKSLEGYQIKGTAEYVTEGDTVKTFKTMVEQMFNGGATAKGALIITPEKIIVTTPGADNKNTHKFYSNFRIATQSAKLGVKGGNLMYQKKLEKDIRCHPDLQLF